MIYLVLLLLTAAAAWPAEMKGYISDAACGWNNARPGNPAKECAQKCVKGGWDPVFVRKVAIHARIEVAALEWR